MTHGCFYTLQSRDSVELDLTHTNAGLTAPRSPNPSWLEVKQMFESAYPSFGGSGSSEALIDGVWRPVTEAMHLGTWFWRVVRKKDDACAAHAPNALS